jgi:hypothetical protein
MDRRSMLLTTGIGMLAAAAAIPVQEAAAYPYYGAPPKAPSASGGGPFIFSDEFDGPAGSVPDPGKWTVQSWQDDVFPPVAGIYRDDRRNVFQDGNSNLVLRATQEGDTYYGAKLRGNFRSMINQTWEARIKLNCLDPGLWSAFWGVNEDPLPDGEIDVFEWYGNGSWPPGTTVHAASNGKTWEGRSIPGLVDGGWHTWQMHWAEDGFHFARDGAGYFSVPNKPIPVHGNPSDTRWPFNKPGYFLTPMFTLAVGGVGAGDPAAAHYPADMLVDWIHIW